MAATRFSTASFLVISSMLLAIASATEYISASEAAVKHQSSYGLKPDFDLKPKPDDTVSPDLVAKPAVVTHKPASGEYVSTPELDKLRLRMLQYQNGRNQPKQVIPEPRNGYGPKPEVVQHPEPQTSSIKPAPYAAQKVEDGFKVGVEGIVACKSGSDYFPLQGAVVRISCTGLEKEKQVWSLTDERGYFFKILPAHMESENCKAFLEKSPLQNCSVGTDVNKGNKWCQPLHLQNAAS